MGIHSVCPRPAQDAFQSPRSGKFESNWNQVADWPTCHLMFQSPRSGKFESNLGYVTTDGNPEYRFQSPRSGKFESNADFDIKKEMEEFKGFNPLDRGNLNQMGFK